MSIIEVKCTDREGYFVRNSIKYKIEEKEIRIVLKIEDKEYINIGEKEQFQNIGNGFYVRNFDTVEEGIEFIKKMKLVLVKIEDVLILKDYIILWNDADDTYEFVNLLFKPKSSIGDYGLSRINFYTEIEGDTYSVDLDYGFDADIKISVSKMLEGKNLCAKFEDYMNNFEKIVDNILKEE